MYDIIEDVWIIEKSFGDIVVLVLLSEDIFQNMKRRLLLHPFSDVTLFSRNALLPEGMKKMERYRTRFCVRIYKAEGLPKSKLMNFKNGLNVRRLVLFLLPLLFIFVILF